MSLMSLRRRRATTKGFNLIEAAIVLGIVGLVVGGIWVAATSVYSNLRSKTATDQLLGIAQNFRALYATQSTAGAASTNLTTSLATVFPSDMLLVNPPAAAGDVVNPWNTSGGGNVSVFVPATNTQFVIAYGAVPRAACVDFIARNGGASGLVQVNTAAGAIAVPIPLATVAAGATLVAAPITPATAAAACANAFNNIFFTFALKG